MPTGFTYSWTANTTSWSFNGCRDGWTRFDREDSVSVCMQIFLQNNIAYNTSKEVCSAQSAVLTGLASLEECKWVQARVFQITTEDWMGFWIDGVRNCTDGQTCQTFAWTDGYTTNYDVLYDSTNADLAVSPAGPAYECCLTVGYTSPQTINDDKYCLMAYLDESVECYHYRYTSRPKTIVVKELKDERVVAIKAIIPPDLLSTCPSTHDSLDFSMTIPSGDTYSWTKSLDGYSLNPCRDTWKSFSRTDGNMVCLQIFQVNNIDQPAAKKFCMDREANLTGVASVEETSWMHETLEEIPPVNEFDSFWIDGERQCAEDYQCDVSGV
ncbi:hypothetical protein CAEBREN_10901 [Caenorhabditis brenneri]|uniref:PAN-3 domain-containing protein n=1 Tax=Caenorhabditis brenneri TaxID=135651 RepID=G0NFM0_CAEBE|nr:hypothetical protein CAEBREN_10901 [Caenorhabditis brenneri]